MKAFFIIIMLSVSLVLFTGCQHEGVSNSSIIDIAKSTIIQHDNVKVDNIKVKKVIYYGKSHWGVTYQITDKDGNWIVHGVNVQKMKDGKLKAYFASKG